MTGNNGSIRRDTKLTQLIQPTINRENRDGTDPAVSGLPTAMILGSYELSILSRNGSYLRLMTSAEMQIYCSTYDCLRVNLFLVGCLKGVEREDVAFSELIQQS